MRLAVQLPPSEELNEWLAVNSEYRVQYNPKLTSLTQPYVVSILLSRCLFVQLSQYESCDSVRSYIP